MKMMKYKRPAFLWTLTLVLTLTVAWTQPVWAQLGGFGTGSDPKLQVSAQFTSGSGSAPPRLFVTAKITAGWHIYSITQEGDGPIRSEIRLPEGQGMSLLAPFQVHPAPDAKSEPLFDNLIVETHHGTVVWHAPVRFDPGVEPAKLTIRGTLWAQACSDTACMPPQDFAFTATMGPGEEVPASQLGSLPVSPVASPAAMPPALPSMNFPAGGTPPLGPPSQSGSRPLVPPSPFSPIPEPQVPEASTDDVGTYPVPQTAQESEESEGEIKWHPYTNLEDFSAIVGTKGVAFDPEQVSANLKKQHEARTLPFVLLAAFVGGIILNLMPCVLPVIGLKVLSFVTQAGESRGRALMLNVVYSAGIIAVFLLLAGLAVGLGLGWGQLFTYGAFNVVMASVVFAMGLSFLGVWEIPIPGFVGSGKSAQIQQKEGLSAAFLKGIITTILATPCTGPFMASALTWAVAQPPAIVFAVFLAIGLGMSSPYLLIGAFPELIRFLPKPGAWMETFKQIMGFFLLGTVVFLLSFLDWPLVVPTVGLLFAIWAGLWWFNRTPVTAVAGEKWRAWLEATAFVGLAWLLLFPGVNEIVPSNFGMLSFHGLHDEMEERFVARVGDVGPVGPLDLDGPRTVLVDFTADWCLTCKALEAKVLHSPSVVEAFQRDKVVLLKADYTRRPPEVERFLAVLGSKQVPIIAVFSPDDPNSPIVFRDGYTQQMILDALDQSRPRS